MDGVLHPLSAGEFEGAATASVLGSGRSWVGN
jgi:hypothetical protein